MPPRELEPPAHLPRAEADLEDWAVYADWLQTQGDPRGELMALDLGQPAELDRPAVRAFHDAGRRLCRERPRTPVTWSVAHAASLTLAEGPARHQPPSLGAFANATDFVRTSVGSRLERLVATWPTVEASRHWRRLMAALPATCTVLRLVRPDEWRWRAPRPAPLEPAALLAELPPGIQQLELSLREHAVPAALVPLVDDRLAVIDIGSVWLDARNAQLVTHALAATARVRLRCAHLEGDLVDHPRLELGHPGDAAVIQAGRRRLVALRRWDLTMRQWRYGRLPIRAALARRLAESYTLTVLDVGGSAVVAARHGDSLVRRGDVWSLRAQPDQARIHNGEPLTPAQCVALHDGDTIALGDAVCTFAARIPDARAP